MTKNGKQLYMEMMEMMKNYVFATDNFRQNVSPTISKSCPTTKSLSGSRGAPATHPEGSWFFLKHASPHGWRPPTGNLYLAEISYLLHESKMQSKGTTWETTKITIEIEIYLQILRAVCQSQTIVDSNWLTFWDQTKPMTLSCFFTSDQTDLKPSIK